MDAGTSGVTGPKKDLWRISFLSAPVAMSMTFRAAITVPMPMVKAAVGTSSREAKKRLLASRVMAVSSTSWVILGKWSQGSLKPMWPSWPMPRSCRSTPPQASIWFS